MQPDLSSVSPGLHVQLHFSEHSTGFQWGVGGGGEALWCPVSVPTFVWLWQQVKLSQPTVSYHLVESYTLSTKNEYLTSQLFFFFMWCPLPWVTITHWIIFQVKQQKNQKVKKKKKRNVHSAFQNLDKVNKPKLKKNYRSADRDVCNIKGGNTTLPQLDVLNWSCCSSEKKDARVNRLYHWAQWFYRCLFNCLHSQM